MKKCIRVFAPATVANVGPGFDVLGFALDEPGDIVQVCENELGTIGLIAVSGDDGDIPRNVEKNVATHVARQLLNHLKVKAGLDIQLEKGVPLSSGLGGSAASAVASVFAVNELFGRPLSRRELLPFAMEGERLASGAPHADNVSPSLFGGFTVIRSYDPIDVIQVPFPKDLICVVVNPEYYLRTEDSRSVLPQNVPLSTAVRQWGNIAALIAGLSKDDFSLIGRAIEDHIAEPVRGPLIPAFSEVKKAALVAGALGCSISGSGPSVFAIATDQSVAEKIGNAMQRQFTSHGLKSRKFISKINAEGPRIL